jgi:hypothetical protein
MKSACPEIRRESSDLFLISAPEQQILNRQMTMTLLSPKCIHFTRGNGRDPPSEGPQCDTDPTLSRDGDGDSLPCLQNELPTAGLGTGFSCDCRQRPFPVLGAVVGLALQARTCPSAASDTEFPARLSSSLGIFKSLRFREYWKYAKRPSPGHLQVISGEFYVL